MQSSPQLTNIFSISCIPLLFEPCSLSTSGLQPLYHLWVSGPWQLFGRPLTICPAHSLQAHQKLMPRARETSVPPMRHGLGHRKNGPHDAAKGYITALRQCVPIFSLYKEPWEGKRGRGIWKMGGVWEGRGCLGLRVLGFSFLFFLSI